MKNQCKGIVVYRGIVNTHINYNTIGHYRKLKRLKRKSCNCEKCFQKEYRLYQYINYLGYMPGLEEIEHGKLYIIKNYIEKGNPTLGEGNQQHFWIHVYEQG